jgi:hypothetical protein
MDPTTSIRQVHTFVQYFDRRPDFVDMDPTIQFGWFNITTQRQYGEIPDELRRNFHNNHNQNILHGHSGTATIADGTPRIDTSMPE